MAMGTPVVARTHLAGCSGGLEAARVLGARSATGALSSLVAKEGEVEDIRRHERTGRPLGDAGFLAELEARFGRRPRPGERSKANAVRAGNRLITYGVV